MPSEEILPIKKDVTRALLLKGNVFVHLDPRAAEVVVPEWLTQQPQLVLQVGLDMPVPISDLRVDHAGVFGTLSFKGRAFTCIVPWDAVFAVMGDDGRGMVWPDSMPPEIAAEVEREAERQHGAGSNGSAPDRSPARALAIAEEPATAERNRPALAAVPALDDRDSQEDDRPTLNERPAGFSPSDTAKGPRPNHLRLVK